MDEEGNPEVPERRNRRPIIVGVAIVAVAALAIGGVYGYRAYEGHKMSVARQACQSAVADQTKAVKAYRALLGSDGIVAALRTDVKSVKNARTVDTLSKAAEAELPAMVKCDASKAAGLDAAAKAVEASRLDKTVANAEALYKATDGKVQDDKTREALAKAVKARDAKAIAKAVKAVNDSKAAKEKADAEAKTRAEQEAQAQAAAGGSQSTGGSGYSSGSYSGGTASAGRSSGSTGGWSYSGGAFGGSASSGNGGGASGGNGGSTSSTGNGGSTGGTPSIPSTSGCTTSITGECSTAPGGEVWW